MEKHLQGQSMLKQADLYQDNPDLQHWLEENWRIGINFMQKISEYQIGVLNGQREN
jgi:hypothetical protein